MFLEFISHEESGESSDSVLTYPLTPDQVPLFLIPGILGNGSEFASVYSAITNAQTNNNNPALGSRPFFSYFSESSKTSLIEEAEEIARAIIAKQSPSPAPYLIVGYSYGCILAATVAELIPQLLKNTDINIKILLIDSATPTKTSAYFNSRTPEALADLIKIITYAAKLANPEIISDISFSETELSSWQKLEPIKCIALISDKITSIFDTTSVEIRSCFENYVALITQRIQNLLDFSSMPDLSLTSTEILITENTAKKYDSIDCGWQQLTDNLKLIQHSDLVKQEHTALLEEGENSNHIAEIIQAFCYRSTKNLIQAYSKQIEDMEKRYSSDSSSDEKYGYFDEDTEIKTATAKKTTAPGKFSSQTPLSLVKTDTEDHKQRRKDNNPNCLFYKSKKIIQRTMSDSVLPKHATTKY